MSENPFENFDAILNNFDNFCDTFEEKAAEAASSPEVDVRIGKEIAGSGITQAHYHTQDEHGRRPKSYRVRMQN